MKKPLFILSGVAVLYLLIFFGYSVYDKNPKKKSDELMVSSPRKKAVEKYNTSSIPEGIEIYGFEEKYDKPYGRYELYFTILNRTGKPLKYPQVDGDLYVDGKLEGTVTGGPGKHLEDKETGVIGYAWILPNKVPDSIIFKYIQ